MGGLLGLGIGCEMWYTPQPMRRTQPDERWYVAGLHFECQGCGACCAGPSEGVVWVTGPEIRRIAEYLQVPDAVVRDRYVRKEGTRTTLVEDPCTRDCIFLQTQDGRRVCRIYPVRPNQCRTWPFWPGNLTDPDDWNRAATRCPGINRGKAFSAEVIDRLKTRKRWCDDEDR